MIPDKFSGTIGTTSMKVTIKLFATLRDFGPEEQERELPENSTIEDVIRMLKLPEQLPILKFVNGE